MDPLAHTLVGASLSETRLRRLSPLATPTLILAANAPDVDAISMAFGGDLSLGFRRGWTHGVLAMIVLPLVLGALIVAVDRAVASLRRRESATRAGPVIGLCYVGLLTHPFLDWLNTYGIRLLMPFDGRWFYGDALFVIDPWMWLLAAAAVMLARTETWFGRVLWITLGVVLTSLVTGVAAVPAPARLAWLAGVAALLSLRLWGRAQTSIPRVATVCLVGATIYIAAMAVGSRIAAHQVESWLAERGDVGTVVMAGPVPADPFVRDVVVRDEWHYHFIEVAWTRLEPIRVVGTPIERGLEDDVVEAALRAPHVQGVRTWMRLPAYHVQRLSNGYRVIVRDVRYGRSPIAGVRNAGDPRTDGIGLGTAVVELDHDLRVQPSR